MDFSKIEVLAIGIVLIPFLIDFLPELRDGLIKHNQGKIRNRFHIVLSAIMISNYSFSDSIKDNIALICGLALFFGVYATGIAFITKDQENKREQAIKDSIETSKD
ncbi:hypothetical protein [Pseudoalteromonas spongiae]|uniref:Uncharacterized protein n=1 Tax=Pseudoalteromonas spongiae TaxID=298657 RepID=A0ABU8EW49_9GAMM